MKGAELCRWKRIASATLLLVLAGCASFSEEELAEWRDISQNRRIVCQGFDQCTYLWNRAREWAFDYASHGIRIATDNLIETRGPPRSQLIWRYRVIRSRTGPTSERIYLDRNCIYTVFSGPEECDRLFLRADASFKSYVLELE